MTQWPDGSMARSSTMPEAIETRYRNHTCGQLRSSDVAKVVKLAGWVHSYRDHGGLVFIDLRDRDGVTQVIFDPDSCGKEVHDDARKLRSEWVISVEGEVEDRGPGMHNPKLPTGDRGARAEDGSAERLTHAAVHPARDRDRERGTPAAIPLHRPPPRRD